MVLVDILYCVVKRRCADQARAIGCGDGKKAITGIFVLQCNVEAGELVKNKENTSAAATAVRRISREE
jgi:hypothetical protein